VRLGAIIATLAFLLPAASATAAQRFASSSGSGTSCTQAAPCDVVTAVNNAASGDDVTIEPGTYNVSTTLDDGTNELTIHGQAGQPMPVIDSTAGFAVELTGGGSLSGIDVEDSAANAWGVYVAGQPASIDHVVAHVTGSGATACYPFGTITDSLCRAEGQNGVALTVLIALSGYAMVRNDTLIAPGTGGIAVLDHAVNGTQMEIDLRNTIARGASADIEGTTDTNTSSIARVTAENSNFATVNSTNSGGTGVVFLPAAGSGTNQTASPVFVGNGDYHEGAGSPTIDAGADTPANLSTDLDGNPRQLGAHTDIGAYEFVPPPACQALTLSTAFGHSAPIQLQCSDAAGAPLTYAIASNPAHGTVSTSSTGVATYTPAAGYSGSDSFTYRASSAHGTAAPATVSVTVGLEPKPVLSQVHEKHGTFSFTLNEPAKVRLVIKRHGKKVAKLKVNGKAGKNKKHFGGRLKPGRYTVVLTASNAAGSTSKKLGFTVHS
jgi:hypothetical protein